MVRELNIFIVAFAEVTTALCVEAKDDTVGNIEIRHDDTVEAIATGGNGDQRLEVFFCGERNGPI